MRVQNNDTENLKSIYIYHMAMLMIKLSLSKFSGKEWCRSRCQQCQSHVQVKAERPEYSSFAPFNITRLCFITTYLYCI